MPNTTQFSGEFETGRVLVGTTPVQLPNIRCKQVAVKPGAGGFIAIGNSDSVMLTTGFAVATEATSPFLPVDNLSQLWVVANVASHPVDFMALL